jgi:nucleoside-diphosphate-sugar epimerase
VNSKLHIWITGAGGFLGNRLVKHFSDSGHKIVGLSRRKSNAETSVEIDLSTDRAPNQIAALAKVLGTPDVLIHAASKQPGPGSLAEFVGSNTKTTINLIDGLIPTLPARIIFTSTHSLYARTFSLPVPESAPAGGEIPYGATKRWSEEALLHLPTTGVTILRLPSLYGVGQADSFIDGLARLARQNEPLELFSNGELIRDVLHVSDVVTAVAACLDMTQEKSTILNIGCGQPTRTLEYANALVKALGSNSKIVPVETRARLFDFYADISEAKRSIDFVPTPLDESMRRYADELRTRS